MYTYFYIMSTPLPQIFVSNIVKPTSILMEAIIAPVILVINCSRQKESYERLTYSTRCISV